MDDGIILFVKFSEEKYIKRLFDGKLYFSNAERFRNIEKKNGLKGQGDAYEAVFQSKSKYAIAIDHHTGRTITLPDATVSLELADTGKIPVFCITCITMEDCEIIESNGKRNLIVNNIVRETIKKHFPKADTACVFYQPQLFLNSLHALGRCLHDRVQYFDFSHDGVIKEMIEYVGDNPGMLSKRNKELLSMHMETNDGNSTHLLFTERNMNRILFCKDVFFSNEKEYRVILPNKRIETAKDYFLRWGKQQRKILPIDAFFSGIEI